MSRIFLGRLAFDARERDVERFLHGFGRIREISLKKGYGFVEFEDSRDAEDAIDELDGKELLGERVSVQFAKGQRGEGGRFGGRGRFGGGRGRFGNRNGGRYGPPTRTNHRVIVENLSSRTSWQDLKDCLRKEGRVTYADAHKQRVGEGIVEFASRNDMKNVIKRLDNTELGGKKIRIFEDDAHGGSYSRSRSRSRSRSPKRVQRSRSASRSPVWRRSRSRSPSRSRSRTPIREGSHSPEDDN